MKILLKCDSCLQWSEFVVNGDDIRRWRRGDATAVVAMPYLSPEQIRILETGKCCDLVPNTDGMFDL